MKIGVIFGGISTEHDVSVVSGTSVIKNLNKSKYDILPIYIDKNGVWYIYNKNITKIDILNIGEEPQELEKVENIIEVINNCDVIFPILHGIGGEDGSIQGMLKMLNKPFVGCGILASSIGMDKIYTKTVLNQANIKQAKYEYVRKNKEEFIYVDNKFNEKKMKLDEICKIIYKNLKYPLFVKPSNSGSSVGVTRVETEEKLAEAIKFASKFDKKVLIEEGIKGREIECAVLGNDEIITSNIGEIIASDKFYNYDEKYNSQESKTKINIDLPEGKLEEIKKIAQKAFKAIDGKGLARVDFFIEDETNEIILNEINTMPGFTKISMYPQLMQNNGISYEKLLDKLIELAIENS
jgi:D-alanine-D-alanine ligase